MAAPRSGSGLEPDLLGRSLAGAILANSGHHTTRKGPNRKGAMAKFREVKIFQRIAVVYASIHDHFNQGRYLNRRDIFK